MSDYLKISWSSGCTFSDVYYGDGYEDFLFFPVNKVEVSESVYEVVRKETTEKAGRNFSTDKLARKSYKISCGLPESVCDTVNTIPLADIVKIQFPEGTQATITGDDVTLNIEWNKYIANDDINVFTVSIIFLTNVTVKSGCYLSEGNIIQDVNAPTIISDTITASGTHDANVNLIGTGETNYFIKAWYRLFWQEKTINKNQLIYVSYYSALAGFGYNSIDGEIYKTIDGFETNVLSYTPAGAVSAIKCISDQIIIALGTAGNIYRTANGGTTWAVVNVGHAENLNGINNLSWQPDAIIICGNNGTVVSSDDSGATFTVQCAAGVKTASNLLGCGGFHVPSLYDKWTCCGANGDMLNCNLNTYVGANTWTLVNSGAENYTCVIYDTKDKVYIGSDTGTIKDSQDGAGTWINYSIGTYTGFYASIKTSYGILFGGNQSILIQDTLHLLLTTPSKLRSLTNFGDSIAGGLTGGTIYNNNIAFTEAPNPVTSIVYANSGINVIVPNSLTYVFKVQNVLAGYDGIYSSEYVVYT